MAKIKEVILPRTNPRQSLWVKVLDGVSPTAKDGNDWFGSFHQPSAVVDLDPGSVVLERIEKGRQRIHVIWILKPNGSWDRVAKDDSPAWSVTLRKVARDLLQKRVSDDA